MHVRLWLAVLALAFSVPCSAADADAARAEISQVIATFQSSLRQHDAKTLGGLFLADSDA